MTEDFKQFARERSHRDVESTGEYGRLMVQFVAGANGLAATAILTLIGAFKSEALAGLMSFPLGFFLAGMYGALSAAHKFYDSQDKFASMWEQKSYETSDSDIKADRLFKEAVNVKADAFYSVKESLNHFMRGGLVAAVFMGIFFFHASTSSPSAKTGADKKSSTLVSLDCSTRER